MTDVILVACSKGKAPRSCRAEDMYTSNLFTLARQYARERGRFWFILSAKHGLTWPSKFIDPYDLSLNDLSWDQNAAWSEGVANTLKRSRPFGHFWKTVEILAGDRYRRHLIPRLQEQGLTVSVPMQGLRIGSQVQWLSKQVRR